MKLIELSPKWLHTNLFAFKCPHCLKDWLTVKDAEITRREQCDIYEQEFGSDWNMKVVPCKPDYKWTFSTRDFSNISVSPSIDASVSHHWHGHITGGLII